MFTDGANDDEDDVDETYECDEDDEYEDDGWKSAERVRLLACESSNQPAS